MQCTGNSSEQDVAKQIRDLYRLVAELKFENQTINEEQQISSLPQIELDRIRTHLTTRVLFINAAKNFLAPGIPNVFSAENKLARIIWLVCIVISYCACCYYLVENCREFFSLNVVSSIKDVYSSELTFPSFIICSWLTEFRINEAIVNCAFNQKKCNITHDFKQVIVLGNGLDGVYYCTRFNGKSSDLRIRNVGLDYGLTISFLVPPDVS